MSHPITKPALIRLIKDASFDAIQISGLVYEEMRSKLIKHVEHIIDKSLIYMAHANLKTLSDDNVVSALPVHPILGGKKDKKSIKTCKKSAKKSAKKKKETDEEGDGEQSDGEQGDGEQSDIEKCFYFPKQAFRHFVVSLTGDKSVRISSDALALLQIEAEHFLLKLASQAANLMQHAGRATLQPKDVHLANLLAASCSQKGVVNVSSSKTVSLIPSIEAVFKKMKTTENKKDFNTILNAVGQALVNKAESLAIKSTIASRDVETAVRLVLPGDLANYAIKNVDKIKDKLLFSVESVSELFRKNTDLTVSENAVKYLVAVLEYMTAELVRGDDEEINELYKNLGLFIAFRK